MSYKNQIQFVTQSPVTEFPYPNNYFDAVFTNPLYYDCRRAEKIAPHNRVYFSTREEAIRAGYRPCKVCKPWQNLEMSLAGRSQEIEYSTDA